MPGGFAIVFADGGQYIFVSGSGKTPLYGTLTADQARDLAVEVARALSAAWFDAAQLQQEGSEPSSSAA